MQDVRLTKSVDETKAIDDTEIVPEKAKNLGCYQLGFNRFKRNEPKAIKSIKTLPIRKRWSDYGDVKSGHVQIWFGTR